MPDPTPEEPESEHGIEAACYAGGPGVPYYQPVMICTCGFTTDRCDNWEEAGMFFDHHLAEYRSRRG